MTGVSETATCLMVKCLNEAKIIATSFRLKAVLRTAGTASLRLNAAAKIFPPEGGTTNGGNFSRKAAVKIFVTSFRLKAVLRTAATLGGMRW